MRVGPHNWLACCVEAALLWFAFAFGATAQRSYAVVLDQAQGLDAGEIAALAQDRTGFIWIGANGGLLRYDGAHFVWWGAIHTLVNTIVASKSGEVIAATESGAAFSVVGNGVTRLRGPQGRPVTRIESLAFDEHDELWALIARRLWIRTRTGAWKAVASSQFGNESPQHLSPLKRGMGLLTDRSAWLLHGDVHSGERLMTGKALFAIVETGNAQYWLADRQGAELWRRDNSGLAEIGRPRGRLMAMAARGGTLWVSIDRYLLSADEESRKRVQGEKEGIPSGGPLLVDRDGALWLGTFVGLLRFPEPDTQQWTEEDGLPSNHAHGITRVGDDIWVNTWQGAARFIGGDIRSSPVPEIDIDGEICNDRIGGAWMTSAGRVYHWREGTYRTVPDVPARRGLEIAACIAMIGGKTLLAASSGLYLANDRDERARFVARGQHGRTGFRSVWSTGSGDVWLADLEEACRYERDAAVGAAAFEPVECAALPPNTGMSTGVEVAPGLEWLPLSSGLAEIKNHRARRLPGNAALPGASIQTLERAPSGGYWAVGPGAFLRIVPCASCSAGWRLLEKPGAGQGIPGNSASDVLETQTGDIWLAGNRGVFRIPATARVQAGKPEALVLVSAIVDGSPVRTANTISIAPEHHRLELAYSALYFRDPSRLVYRYRFSPNAVWSSPTTEPVLQLIDQTPGGYTAQMQASLDGRNWTAPAGVGFVVLPPFWRSTPALAAYALLAFALLALAYQLRVRHLLSLERQRLSIARDLHDELGSSLGSIVALSGVLNSPATDVSDRHRVAGQISSAAQLAGAGLRSLVWTMRKEAVDAAAFGREIAEHAQRLTPQPPPLLQFSLPQGESDTRFGAELRRQVLMIVLEAVHNVVRHAAANQISITFRARDSRWLLTIADDGRGFDAAAKAMGNGLESMRWRARKIGGTLATESAPGEGTRIVLAFAVRKRHPPTSREPVGERDHA